MSQGRKPFAESGNIEMLPIEKLIICTHISQSTVLERVQRMKTEIQQPQEDSSMYWVNLQLPNLKLFSILTIETSCPI